MGWLVYFPSYNPGNRMTCVTRARHDTACSRSYALTQAVGIAGPGLNYCLYPRSYWYQYKRTEPTFRTILRQIYTSYHTSAACCTGTGVMVCSYVYLVYLSVPAGPPLRLYAISLGDSSSPVQKRLSLQHVQVFRGHLRAPRRPPRYVHVQKVELRLTVVLAA